MRHLIVGTAGHIDHGKTSLVRALTGIDTDRLEEEKRRGISIDLGFANLDLDGGLRIGLVDVPGHERFIKNMLAGASGIDVVLFVIAADESIKPQTREHFEICRLLGIPQGIVVLTKSDLVDADILGLVRLEVEEFVTGSFLENAPIVAVSATTGAGIPELKNELARIAVTQKDSQLRTRLPIDRAFSMKGFGTVVTGTLTAGSINVESELELHPAGRRVRVRGLHVHGSEVKKALAGQRTAVNLAGIEPSEIARGMTLAEPGSFVSVSSFDARIELLASAPKPLKQGTPVHLHLAAAEAEAEIRLFQNEPIRPGSRNAFARLILKEPLLALPGDRFVIRMFSPVVTIGGGTVIDVAPPKRLKRPLAAARLARLTAQTKSENLAEFVRESPAGLSLADVIRRTGWTRAAIDASLKHPDLLLLTQPQWWLMSREWSASKLKSIRDTLQQYHKTNPLQAGLSKEELRSRLMADSPAFLLDALIAGNKEIAVQADLLRLTSHRVTFKEDEGAALAKIEAAFEHAGLTVPATADVLTTCGVEQARSKPLLQMLLKQQKLVKIGDELIFHASAIAKLREILAAHKGQRFAVPEFKEWTGISRKYAIPLLEYLDRDRVTRRDGDTRVVL